MLRWCHFHHLSVACRPGSFWDVSSLFYCIPHLATLLPCCVVIGGGIASLHVSSRGDSLHGIRDTFLPSSFAIVFSLLNVLNRLKHVLPSISTCPERKLVVCLSEGVGDTVLKCCRNDFLNSFLGGGGAPMAWGSSQAGDQSQVTARTKVGP